MESTPPGARRYSIEAGLLERSDWTVPFVSPSPAEPQGELRPGYLLRAEWDGVDPARIRRARVYSTAHGVYELELNGAPVVGRTARARLDELQPPAPLPDLRRDRGRPQRPQRHRRLARRRLVPRPHRLRRRRCGTCTGATCPCCCSSRSPSTDGARRRRSPRPTPGAGAAAPITSAGLYEGEAYDARLLPSGWSDTGFDDPALAETRRAPLRRLRRRDRGADRPAGPGHRGAAPDQRRGRSPAPASVSTSGRTSPGSCASGHRADAGHTVTLHHAEVLENGRARRPPPALGHLRRQLHLRRRRRRGVDARASRSTASATPSSRTGRAASTPSTSRRSSCTPTWSAPGWFESSHAGLNRLHENVVWSMRDNFVDLPTDCPQRDERLGWTGDIQVFAPTAPAPLRRARHAQRLAARRRARAGRSGTCAQLRSVDRVRFPEPSRPPRGATPPSSCRGSCTATTATPACSPTSTTACGPGSTSSTSSTGHTGLWNTGFQLGDWLDPAAPPDSPGDSQHRQVPRGDRLPRADRAHPRRRRPRSWARTTDAAHYGAIAERATTAFQSEYIAAERSGRQRHRHLPRRGPRVRAVRDRGARRRTPASGCSHLVAAGDFHISTGFVGTPIICDALVRAGGIDAAYHLLLQDELPSWLYPVSMGATTIWERWDSMLPDGSVNPGDMTSFNHYALGAVADFMHRVVAGLDSAEPGFGVAAHRSAARRRPHPRVGEPPHAARARRRRPGDGTVTSFTLDVEVPAGSDRDGRASRRRGSARGRSWTALVHLDLPPAVAMIRPSPRSVVGRGTGSAEPHDRNRNAAIDPARPTLARHRGPSVSRLTADRSSSSTASSTGTARTRRRRRRATGSGTGECAATHRRTSTTGRTAGSSSRPSSTTRSIRCTRRSSPTARTSSTTLARASTCAGSR